MYFMDKGVRTVKGEAAENYEATDKDIKPYEA